MPLARSASRTTSVAVLFWIGALGGACNSSSSAGPSSFESDVPGSSSGGHRDAASGVPASGAVSDTSSAGEADRAISEADVIQRDGDRLYALSRVSGLAVIDASDPSALALVGRYRELTGSPFEMYLRGDVAILMYVGWGQYEKTADDSYAYVTTSKVVALDVADPAAMTPLGSFDVPGAISDSRIVGDVLYVAGYEDGYCWRCEQSKPTTAISSLDVADPRHMRKVDELRYVDANQQWSWQRSITVTDRRMYVAGPEYGDNGPIGSTIQVIDISDAGGDLVPGATLEASGQISSRWQMDEYDGVLRVVSQSPAWRTTEPPRLQTFKVISSQQLEPLAKLDIVIPARESLQSARFDGPRGYLITAERRDPLFTLDLSDPANPKQVGELEMPGFVYHMEPRGDRMLGLGFDQGNPEGSITVSLFDVSKLASPKLLSRVNFGGDWGSLPEDQDRIHKVFRVLPEEGLILVPFMGYKRSPVSQYCGGTSVGGVQVLGYANDALELRGSAPSDTAVRRALVHRDHLLAVSDQRVESFSLDSRDQLELVSKAIISSSVSYAAPLDGDVVARVVSPDWGTTWNVEIAKASSAENVDRKLSELSLASVFQTDPEMLCNQWWGIDSYHAAGTTLYLKYSGSRGAKLTNEQESGIIAIDASDPTKPRIAGRTSWVESQDNGGGWSPYYGDYYGGFSQPSPYVWNDRLLAFLEQKFEYDGTNWPQTSVRLRVVDLRDPKKLATTTLPLGDNQTYTGLIADGDQLITSRADAPRSAVVAPKLKFFADRFDVSTPTAPKLIESTNVPGVVIYVDRDSGRALTSQMGRTLIRGLTGSECYDRFAQADFNLDSPNQITTDASPGTCTGYTQSLHLVALHGDVAGLEDSIKLKDDQLVTSWSAGDGRLFAAIGTSFGFRYGAGVIVDCAGPCGGPAPARDPIELFVVSGFASGKLNLARLAYESTDDGSWPGYFAASSVVAHGDKALLFASGDVATIDAVDAKAPKITRTLPLAGYPQSVEFEADRALVALGEQGLQWIEL
jgi:hypothetical protein